MTKYDLLLKAEVINNYLQRNCSYNDLAEEYNLPSQEIGRWIRRYRLSGMDSLVRRKGKRTFTAEFKLSVIDYYKTHDESTEEVASKYDILRSQVSSWNALFDCNGIEALQPHQKGRNPLKKRSKKQVRKLVNKNEVDRLREELALKNQELYDTKLERDILKKSMTLFGPSKGVKKHK
ncbi:helix-turn-helix domain-containing protein [Companilactobacillus mishanensis]|uniref:Helix-turn-helix domain-containing protein n=1 Tax=Companilactobacillus mishanensis TaxID=2486008 RepID=A0ABW9P6E0_9LACO|nr:helix-turn-helix domain-containing protein [Companilactobacillus mishanensis]MQS44774.1 helix-turn-helix domain-containing protein [Companilactobacillus mishanensis]